MIKPKNKARIARVALAVIVLASTATIADSATKPIMAVGVENEYADVIGQIGGNYVHVTAIETDPNTDPHDFEASPKIARRIAGAALIVENGVGYDAWANRIVAAAYRPGRRIIMAQKLLSLPDDTPNPHLWYAPRTMPIVAAAIAADLAAIQPSHAAYFQMNLRRFDASLKPWLAAIAAFRTKFAGTPVAVTEPVGNYLLQAMGADIRTPIALQDAIMNGTDPSPQDVAAENTLLRDHKVKILVYNNQVTDPLTRSFLDLARRSGIPVVGVYETMPTPGYTYQSWMLAEVRALRAAVTTGRSTGSLTGNAP